MLLKNKYVQLAIALVLGLGVMLLPRPEGTMFEILGDPEKKILSEVKDHFSADTDSSRKTKGYVLKANRPGDAQATAKSLEETAARLSLADVKVIYVDGLSPTAKRFLATLALLLFLFILNSFLN